MRRHYRGVARQRSPQARVRIHNLWHPMPAVAKVPFLNVRQPGKPSIECVARSRSEVAVILENQGEGSDWAAPVFQRIVETYYSGRPQTVLWFESTFGVTETPTPLGGIPTETPEP